MQIISARRTFFYKKVFPVLWFGGLGLAITGILAANKTVPLPVLLVPIIMIGFGYVLLRKLVFDLMDQVYDAGDRLVVKKGAVEDTITLSNIINVSHSIAVNPPRIVLTLRVPGRFGKKVAFCPKLSWSDIRSFGFTNTLADELVTRVDAARRRSAS